MSEAKERLDRLRAKRRGHRGVCTKLAKEVEELTNSPENSDDSRCEIIKNLLQEKLKLLNNIDEEIVGSCDVTDIEHEIEESAEVDGRILNAIKKIEKFYTNGHGQTNQNTNKVNNQTTTSQVDINTPNNTSIITENASDTASNIATINVSENNDNNNILNTSTSSITTTTTSSKTRLPKLSLTRFKGQVTQWNTFWDSFESAVHNNQDISKIDKFNYLNSLLEGTALRAIQGLTLTGANYDAAIEILRDRFGRSQQIITAHMDELLNIPACVGDRVTSLRFVYDKISVHVRGLASLGVSSEQYGSLLIPIIMSKMPGDIRLEIARKATKEAWKIDDLLETIKFELEAREISEATKSTERTPHGGYGSKREAGYRAKREEGGRNEDTPTAKGLLVGTKDCSFEDGKSKSARWRDQGQSGFKIQCAFCNGLHYSASCEQVVTSIERKAILKAGGRCFKCLYKGHNVRDCKGPRNCRRCNGHHHQSICTMHDSSSQYRVPTQGQDGKAEKPEETSGVTMTSAENTNKRHVLLQTACATAVNADGSKSTSVRILFDNGSQRSYITDSLRSKLDLKPTKNETLHLNTFGDNKYKTQKCQLFTLNFETRHGQIFPISALNFPVICTPLATKFDVSDYPHLQELDLADCTNDDRQCIDVLIGSDHYWDFITGEVIRGEDGPLAIASEFGWLLSGPTKLSSIVNQTEVVNNLIISGGSDFDYANEAPDEITSELKRFWDVEAIGICDERADESHPIPNELSSDMVFNGKRYEVGLPWKQDRLPLRDNYESCHNRLLSLHRRLRKQPKLLDEYDKIIQDQLDAGIVEKVLENESESLSSVGTYYSPHHPVIRQDKDTTKVRIVYDGSAKPGTQELSLNDCLETGPNFIPHIFDMLVRFRSNRIAVTADIEKAFLMVGIENQHKNMLRFLWLDNPFSDNPATIALRFNRLMFGLRPSPSILGSVIQHHIDSFKKSEPKMAELLSKAFYVDDLLTGENTVSKAFEIYERSKEIMASGGFNLRKWKSNSKEFLRRIEQVESKGESQCENSPSREDDESYAKSTTGHGTTTSNEVVKLLGVRWNTCSDTVFFDFAELQKYASSLPITKRSLLSFVAKIFDPLGLLSPFTVTLKILFQILCLDQLDWDQELDGELKLKFLAIRQEIIHLNSIEIPRYYFCPDTNIVIVELHGFSDASQKAYDAVVYLRSIYGDGRVQVTLVAAKSRVAPTKRQSIPRLELLGALILARLTRKIRDVIGEIDTTHWVDSTAALCWIKNDRVWKQYVRNRVTEIRSLTADDSWRYCPGTQNPADLPSRGLEAKELASSETWWNGPDFLHHSPSTWPNDVTTAQGNTINDDAMLEIVKRPPEVIHTLATNEAAPVDNDIANVIDIKRYSNLTRLLRVTAHVLRFVRILKGQHNEQDETTTKELSGKEISEAEILWIKSVQMASFPMEHKLLTKTSKQLSNTNYITQFGLFCDESGVIRCKGRINNSPLPDDCKRPVFMPSKNYFVELLILHVHNSVKHSGLRSTLTTIRERFWILRGRESVKRVLSKCLICARYEGAPFQTQPTPALPDVRVADDPPFTHTGLDFAGPLYAVDRQRGKNSSVAELNSEKHYVLLFTCASTRAVHLELTRGISVPAFLLAFRRFASRRGLPATILSDNAKTFKAADKELRKIVRSQEVQHFMAEKRITWRFIVERAPWWGGFWERLVRSVKRPLKKVIGKSTLSVDELQTILVEIEAVINARPITYVYGDDESISYPLTPSDLIYGRRITTEPNSSHHEVVSTNHSLTKRIRYHKTLLRQLTTQWRREYLTSLREHSTIKSKDSKSREIVKEDVVIVKADSTPRAFWRLARVEELLPGADGKVRAAKLRVIGENGKVYTTRRAVQHLVPIEVSSSTAATSNDLVPTNEEQLNEEQHISDPPTASGRPRRTAAVVGELARRIGH